MQHFMQHRYFSIGQWAFRGALMLALSGRVQGAAGQSFGPPTTYPIGSVLNVQGLALGDLNGDGRLDIVLAYPRPGGGTTGYVGVLLGQAGGGFGPGATYLAGPAGYFITGPVLADVDRDGRLDVALADYGGNAVLVLPGLPGGLLGPARAWPMGSGTSPYTVAAGDVNGDGRVDLVAAHYTNEGLGVLLGQAGGGYAPVAAYATGINSHPCGASLGDVNGDGRVDLVCATSHASIGQSREGAIDVLLGLPGGGFGPPTTYPTGRGSSPIHAVLGDLNGDGRLDVVTSLYSPLPGPPPLGVVDAGAVGVLLGQAGGGFAPVQTYHAGTGGWSRTLALADVDGDGRLDVATAHAGTGGGANTVKIMRGLAGGTLAPPVVFPLGTSVPQGVAAGDVDGDGRVDLVVANSLFDVTVLRNTGTFAPLAVGGARAAAVLSVAPNPASNGFAVRLPADLGSGPVRAELVNALGQVVRRPEVDGTRRWVDVSGLPPGVYTLRLPMGGATRTARVILQ
ncbi:T9SS type A sorting domain-containing protein [Hymenobacter armeniacus]|uniref:T9SS type A sorting domain-containing protein n=1 Tax=Hymenobacter armeniacus TaxID=2771358 RepID=A0ABR8JS07_9BACT|nr:T9SS type A sorting domain-containing protein [Hymenobacter armeniacus]MBD2721738.1 T9SS type A sorting domain-containing protein [Hymenobacter armeniacus]